MVSAAIDANFIAAIGNFDGVHRGHQYLIDKTIACAKRHQARPAVVVFNPHPRRYFRPDDPPFLLTTPAQRDELLRSYGIEGVISLPFNEHLASLTPEAFVHDVLKSELQLAGVVAGADFRFGSGRAGDGAALQRLGKKNGLVVKLVDVFAETHDAEKFGSSAVRNALRDGDVKLAAVMLGRPWVAPGTIVEGQKLGRTIGFPTANTTLGALVEPRHGVYATRATVSGKTFNAVSNFGRRPTVGATAAMLETHLFDFDSDLYGKQIGVAFVEFIRDEQKFEGLDALKAQIAKDCDAARQILA